MAKRRDYRLNEAELKELEEAIKRDKGPGVRTRGIVVRLLHLGYRAEAIAEMQAISKPTGYAYCHRWEEGGVDALVDKPRSGRPPYCSHLNSIERYWRHLKDMVAANRLAESLDVLCSAAEKTLARQNQPDSASRFHLSKNFR